MSLECESSNIGLVVLKTLLAQMLRADQANIA
jgi:hypothetical protein